VIAIENDHDLLMVRMRELQAGLYFILCHAKYDKVLNININVEGDRGNRVGLVM
jgi:hypothetical protein